jgi:hypothetical protein
MATAKTNEPNCPCGETLDDLDDSVDASLESADFDAEETNAKEAKSA